MKKLLIGILALVISLSSTGCSEAKSSSEVDNSRIENSKTSSNSEAVLDTSSEEESSRDNELQINNSKVIASGNCGENGDNVKWKLHEDGLLVIEGSGKMKDYPIDRGAIGGGWGSSSNEMYTTPWKDYNERIKSVVVSEGVSYIGTCSFAGSNVESIKLPDSLESISFHFGVLDYLSTLRIPKGVKRIGIDGDRDIYGLFQNANLENIKVD